MRWGHDDYSLQVENLPKAPPQSPSTGSGRTVGGAGARGVNTAQGGLFDETTDEITSHSAKPQNAGQAAGYSHSTRPSKDDSQVAGYDEGDAK